MLAIREINITYYLSLEVKHKNKYEIVLINSISAQLLAWSYQTEVLSLLC